MNFIRKGGICLLLCICLPSLTFSQELLIHSDRDSSSPTYGQITLLGLGNDILQDLGGKNLPFGDWVSIFKVTVHQQNRAVVGTYEIREDSLIFIPRFLPDPEVVYSMYFQSSGLTEFIPNHTWQVDETWEVQFPSLSESPEVTSISPKVDTLPANILRFYLSFSTPWGLGDPYEFIQLLDEEGNSISEPFVEIPEGLWSPDRKRLTLLIHPGRIKRGVGPNLSMGEVFYVGKSYTLRISVKGKAGESSFEKKFIVSPPIRSEINLDKWNILPPKAGSRQPLVVKTDRLLDQALSERLIHIEGADKQAIKGSFVFDSQTRALIFYPGQPWSHTSYKIQIDSRLEDICGNTPTKVFDVEGTGKKDAPKRVTLPFQIAPISGEE